MRAERIFQILILAGFIFYCQFYKLGSLPYVLYDEGHRATNAYEMSQSGNLIVTTMDYTPDMFGTKPPLMIWLQAICIKLLGMNEFSVRLPAALASTCTILLIVGFVFYLSRNGWAALLSGMVLCTSIGYIALDHGTRWGEYDGILPLFSTLSVILLFLYTEEEKGKQRNLYLFFLLVAITLGILTKGIAILMFGPAFFIYLLIRKQVLSTLTNKYLYAGLAVFIVFALGYYVLRESMNPGFIKAVYNNELGGRYAEVNDGHVGPFSYYFSHIRAEKFGNWYWGLLAGLVLLPFNDDEKRRRMALLLYLSAIGFVLVISSAASKLYWYDMPVYPLFAMIIALVMLQLADYASWGVSLLKPKVALLILMVIFCIQPVLEIIPYVERKEPNDWGNYYDMSYYLRSKSRTNSQDLKDAIYIDQGYMGMPWKLYVDELNDKGMNIRPMYFWDLRDFKTGDKVLSNYQKTNEYIEWKYEYRILEQSGNTYLYQVLGTKSGT